MPRLIYLKSSSTHISTQILAERHKAAYWNLTALPAKAGPPPSQYSNHVHRCSANSHHLHRCSANSLLRFLQKGRFFRRSCAVGVCAPAGGQLRHLLLQQGRFVITQRTCPDSIISRCLTCLKISARLSRSCSTVSPPASPDPPPAAAGDDPALPDEWLPAQPPLL